MRQIGEFYLSNTIICGYCGRTCVMKWELDGPVFKHEAVGRVCIHEGMTFKAQVMKLPRVVEEGEEV